MTGCEVVVSQWGSLSWAILWFGLGCVIGCIIGVRVSKS